MLALLGVGCTGFSHALFINSMRLVSAQFASVIAALGPVCGIAFALLLFSEAPGVKTLSGEAVIIGATIVASRQRSRNAFWVGQVPPAVGFYIFVCGNI